MRYQGILTQIEGLPKPLVTNSQSKAEVERWAESILQKYPKGRVEVTEFVPRVVETIIAEITNGKVVGTVICKP